MQGRNESRDVVAEPISKRKEPFRLSIPAVENHGGPRGLQVERFFLLFDGHIPGHPTISNEHVATVHVPGDARSLVHYPNAGARPPSPFMLPRSKTSQALARSQLGQITYLTGDASNMCS